MDLECMEKINHYCQINKLTLLYDTAGMTGPSHDPEFTIVVKLNDVEYGTGTGKSKKEAKRVAAKKTWEMIEKQSPSSMGAAESATTQTISSPEPDRNYVSLLNIFAQRTRLKVDYPERTRTGDAHAPIFSCSCTISGQVYGRGTGPTVAAAKQAAAKQAFEKVETEKSNGNSIFSIHSNSSQVPTQSDSNSISFEDSAPMLVEKMKDMAVCEKLSPSQRNAQSSALKSKRKLAANFPNVRKEEENKNMSDSDESLPDVDTNTRKGNGNPHTVDKIFLDNFKNIEPIGEGGFGNVFKARSKCDKTTYAIKRVEFTKNVRREAEGLARLTHENIVRYHCSWKGYDHITSRDASLNSDKTTRCLFIQMEFCEKGTLEKWIGENREDQNYHEMAQNKFLQIMKGVEYIHSEKLIHRDLKPPNIFISHDDKIKIGDFGLVTPVAYETLTKNIGTKSYMAPEQFGDRYGKEVDIYALGLIWFEILSALTNHEKNEVWPSVREGHFPESFTNQFPPKASIIKKMLSTDPFKRPSATRILDLVKSVDKEKSPKNYTC
ncbi:interferon-induced, double-stranded RNA-activated protein kinase isoform X1 [Chiroxiphia lanceolata]|uniref:interferon-induced, double-stranded RNA-activated protein kinase isoform X1 n=2 Tax=Chiroxiphia lanceolata TaxID=296741 RepID=UPI0013CF25AE|nr:interferon-induced, double-stranded RNA-activated protein kinase isoform X1 [Chiroxiphia lanceolata]XP_032537630.1 interferon-induced, double-stranded RNA-activated protein kinase isoform X1 [Chiroxiphia lanceolata]XP_032537631.1 interferon-induced, double-stranded RNA-activated protein kinase isoform X1 [Chiroxiphia lanceolata]XP_032537632.1 interferon-induced, double-stranded RNA-activated protein kinase isoform X1 [Chiroxiphia lanceolata]XP_032537633.1 interferon-induced, double-stranded 